MCSTTPSVGLMRKRMRLGSGAGPSGSTKSRLGGSWKVTMASVADTGSALPERMSQGTPDQRQESIWKRRAAKVSTSEPGATPASST